jgi:hypothetical protein
MAIIELTEQLQQAMAELTQLKSVSLSSTPYLSSATAAKIDAEFTHSAPTVSVTEKKETEGTAKSSASQVFEDIEIQEAKTRYNELIKARKVIKNEINQWLQEFESTHGYTATKGDREPIKDKYKTLKITTEQVEVAKETLDAIMNSRAQGSTSAGESYADSDKLEATIITQPSSSLSNVAVTTVDIINTFEPADRGEIVALEDALADMSEKLRLVIFSILTNVIGKVIYLRLYVFIIKNRESTFQIVSKDKEIVVLKTEILKLNETIQSLVAEKRTDVVRRLEDENNTLKTSLSESTMTISELKAFKVKTETKIKELQDRCDNAERELEVRDAADAKSSQPHEEKSILKLEVRLLVF